MEFDKILEVLGVPVINNPSLDAYTAQIKALQDQLVTADPTQKAELSKQINILRQQMNQAKNAKVQELAKKQQELTNANKTV